MKRIIVIFQIYYLSSYNVVVGREFRQKLESVGDDETLYPIFPHDEPPEEIEWRLKEDDVIPDVLSRRPKYVINVSYGPGIRVHFGYDLEPDEVKKEPAHCTWPIMAGRNYTLIMTGADDPCAGNPINREFLQWLVVDIPGCNVLEGTVLAEYVPLKMPPDTGLHRYVFFVYMQPKARPKWQEPQIQDYDDKRRLKFSNEKFARKYNLGDVYAANYFNSEPIPPDDGNGPGVSAYEKGILRPDFGGGHS